MSTNRRSFLQNSLVGAGLLSGERLWAEANHGVTGETPSNQPQQDAQGQPATAGGPYAPYPDQPPRRGRIEPTLAKLQPGAEQQFRAIIEAPAFSYAHLADQVTWKVNGIEGGNTKVGTIDASGLYRAPASAPAPHEVHVCAEVDAVMNRFLFATVLVGAREAAYVQKSSWKDTDHRIRFAHGIALDPQGNLLIADSVGSKVFRYSPDGKLLTEIGAGSRAGSGAQPEAEISRYSRLGAETGFFGGVQPGYFSEPRLAIADPSGVIYVVDTEERRPQIQVFDSDGHFQYAFGQHGMLPGCLIRVHGMALDSKGRLHTEDVESCRINTYDRGGKFISSWGRQGALPGDLNAPHGIYIDPNDEIFVIGYYGPTQKFTADGHYLLSFAHPDPPYHPISFQSVCGDSWGNVYVPMRTEGLAKFSNTGDFIGWVAKGVAVQWAAVARDGTVYILPVDLSKAKRKLLPTVAVYSEL